MYSFDFAIRKRTPSQKDRGSKRLQVLQIYFVHISANVPYSADTTQESDNVELEVGKGVDALPFVGEQGESFLVGERSDGGPRY